MSAPIPAPTQKPPNPFPAWRLKYGVKNASNDELESASESAEWWGWGCGGLVVLGIIGEFIIAILHPPFGQFLERWGPAICDLLIGFGVAGEIMFARIGHQRDGELRNRSNEEVMEAGERARVAEREAELANERAENARLQAEKLRAAHAWRTVTREQLEVLKQELKIGVPITVCFRLFGSDWEIAEYGEQLARAFLSAGWRCEHILAPQTGARSYGLYLPGYGVKGEIVKCVRNAFEKAGLEYSQGWPENDEPFPVDSGKAYVLVAPKPPTRIT